MQSWTRYYGIDKNSDYGKIYKGILYGTIKRIIEDEFGIRI